MKVVDNLDKEKGNHREWENQLPHKVSYSFLFWGFKRLQAYYICDGTLKSNWHTGSQKAFVIGPVYMEKSRTWWEGHALYTATLGERTFYTLL